MMPRLNYFSLVSTTIFHKGFFLLYFLTIFLTFARVSPEQDILNDYTSQHSTAQPIQIPHTIPALSSSSSNELPLLKSGASNSKEDRNLILRTNAGQIRGRTLLIRNGEVEVAAFLGIPYAEPPVNELRFKPPIPRKSWKGVLNATDFGPICYQPAGQVIWDVVHMTNSRAIIGKRKLELYNMSEDCLQINVYSPMVYQSDCCPLLKMFSGKCTLCNSVHWKQWTKSVMNLNGSIASGAKLPVFFFIHGGSYYMNAGRLYPGQVLAGTQNLVVVTFNYRLGPFGFLSTADSAAPGNYGMLDQALALDWVHSNIRHFGGDRKRITLVGNSAGAASVMFHMFSDMSKGKFVGVTIQSGCSGAPWAIQLSPKKHAEDLATQLSCPIQSTKDLVDCIRKFPPEVIMEHAKLEDGLSLAYAAVIDGRYGGRFLSEHPETLIRMKAFHPVPVLTGFTKDEVTIWFTTFGSTTKTKDLQSFVQVDVMSLLENIPSVTPANVAAMIHSVTVQYLYRSGISENDTLGKTSSVSDFISDVGLKAPCIKEMNLLSKHNVKPVFLYEFTYFSIDDIKIGGQDWIGAYHESELQFVFGEYYLNYTNHLRSFNDRKMSDLMMKIWANFARHGTPTPSRLRKSERGLQFHWTNYTELNQDFAVLSLKSHMDKYFLTDRMLFWNFFFPIFRDYAFRYQPTNVCEDWEVLKSSWIFWLMVCFTFLLAFTVSVFLTFKVGKRFQRRNNSRAHNNHHHAGGGPTILNSANNGQSKPHAIGPDTNTTTR